MTLKHHTTASVVISGTLYAVSKSWELALTSLLSGIFIDLDHLYDYLREYGWPIDVPELFRVCRDKHFHYAVVFLHGWEYVAVWGVLAAAHNWHPLLLGLAIGWGHHLSFDQCTNGVCRWGYFFWWRLRNRFVFDVTFPTRDDDH